MYENTEGEFAYSVRARQLDDGKVTYEWEVRHLPSGRLVNSGTSQRSHDAGKTAALETIFEAERSWAAEQTNVSAPSTAPGRTDEIATPSAALAKEEEYVLRCLGGAVVMHWHLLPAAIQRELFQLASSMGEPRLTGQLKERVARFLHKHGDNVPA
jgi:hypothetical protein